MGHMIARSNVIAGMGNYGYGRALLNEGNH